MKKRKNLYSIQACASKYKFRLCSVNLFKKPQTVLAD
uniref:Uncharacterized protein n=1 Tax=Anguilla anguilla TaxID=7936 RepID=A0A0E9S811_ANGAN